MQEPEGAARLEVYFQPDVDQNSRVLFLRYVQDHLTQHAQNVVRLRHYCCGNKKCKDFEKPSRTEKRSMKHSPSTARARCFAANAANRSSCAI